MSFAHSEYSAGEMMELPKVLRSYQREDFSELLNELENKREESRDNSVKAQVDIKQTSTGPHDIVSIARRRRSSKMDNRSMRYAYCRSERIIHDRECSLVKCIPDEEFEMLPEFDPAMITCRYCYRSALVRSGLKEDGKKLQACLGFFNRIGASSRDLCWLLIEHGAQLQWRELHTVRISVKEDSWEIKFESGRITLYHNNYICLPDYTRCFREGYHEQQLHGTRTFHNIVGIMLAYSWEAHAEIIRAEKQAAESAVSTSTVETEKIIVEKLTSGAFWQRVLEIWKRIRNHR